MRSMAKQSVAAAAGTVGTKINPGEPAESLDLRCRSAREKGAALLLDRAEWLTLDDRALVRSVYFDNVKIGAVAAMSGISPSTIRARLRRILRRIDDPCFAFVLAHRDRWPPAMRCVATGCFLHGLPMRRVAAQHRMSIAAVRRHRDAIAALCEAQPPTTTSTAAPPRAATIGAVA